MALELQFLLAAELIWLLKKIKGETFPVPRTDACCVIILATVHLHVP